MLLLAAFAARSAAAPPTAPAFATEFALNFTVTNIQFGFRVVGRWSVDHMNSSGSLNLRERSLMANASLHPHLEIKDYRLHQLWEQDPSLPSGACVGPLDPSLTQPRWALPANASLLPEATVPGKAVWRVPHPGEVCVDFTMSSSSLGGILPEVIQCAPSYPTPLPTLTNPRRRYWGHCTSRTSRLPGEVLAELHEYGDFDFADLPPALFEPPEPHSACPHAGQGEMRSAVAGARWHQVLRGLAPMPL